MFNFDKCFSEVVGEEGGYVNNPKDPGGETKFGISKRQYPDVDIANLTVNDAKVIYKRDYWSQMDGDELPGYFALMVFDFGINAGMHKSVQKFQSALGIVSDGAVGSQTIVSAQTAYNPASIIQSFTALRIAYYKQLDGWDEFGDGWSNRANAINDLAISWIK